MEVANGAVTAMLSTAMAKITWPLSTVIEVILPSMTIARRTAHMAACNVALGK